jgi:hypothetical protein
VNPSRRVLHLRRASLRTGLAAVGVALALAGCSATNPATIATPFPVGEGTNGQIGGEQVTEGDGSWSGNGGIKLRNFLVVSQGANAPGVVVGGISNDTGQPATVELQLAYTGSDGQQQSLGTTSVPVQAGQTVQLGNPAGLSGTASPSSTQAGGAQRAAGPSVWFQVPKVPMPSGSFVTLLARTSSLGGTSFNVPIFPPLEYYASLTPTASATSSPSATLTPTGSPNSSPNPSGAARQTPTGSSSSRASQSPG